MQRTDPARGLRWGGRQPCPCATRHTELRPTALAEPTFLLAQGDCTHNRGVAWHLRAHRVKMKESQLEKVSGVDTLLSAAARRGIWEHNGRRQCMTGLTSCLNQHWGTGTSQEG